MEKYIISKNQIVKVDAEKVFDLLCPDDLTPYNINGQIYYSWSVFDTWKDADKVLREMIITQVKQGR